MPDGTSAGSTTDPGTPEDQINATVQSASLFETVSNALSPIMGIIGNPMPYAPDTGGGGAGGSYMFASLEEIDGVIQQWQDLVDDIEADQRNIKSAGIEANTPAGDPVSGNNYNASSKVVMAMQKHNETLLEYAIGYVKKLQDCRTQISTTEQGNQDKMNKVH
ncbi:MAG TPA: hypothetical protein VGP26_24965 [Actinophytocola sp.]|nr:hypothetical protein [Actinophytocola sp.]